jgi:hypothetical protein
MKTAAGREPHELGLSVIPLQPIGPQPCGHVGCRYMTLQADVPETTLRIQHSWFQMEVNDEIFKPPNIENLA